MENLISDFVDSIYKLLVDKKKSQGFLVKKHSEHLDKFGDFSFPNAVKCWYTFLSENTTSDILSYKNNTPEGLIKDSENWCLNISKITLQSDRLHLHLERKYAIEKSLQNGFNNCTTLLKKLHSNIITNVKCDPTCKKSNNLSSLRVKYVTKAVENINKISPLSIKNNTIYFVTDKSTNKSADSSQVILCGCVLNVNTGGKETKILDDEFIQKRHNEMMLIAQHKYGVRVATDLKWKGFLEHLGISAVKFELLQIKPSNSIKINFNVSTSGSSKGAAFVLYNCARLESILKTFNDKVNEGYYPQLPPYDKIDFSLLNLEDEWSLVFNYVLGFPCLIEDCVTINEKRSEFRPHNICSFLSSMVRLISQYYRRTRILTESRSHLLPVMYARIYLLKTLNEILKSCLAVIDIKSVTQM